MEAIIMRCDNWQKKAGWWLIGLLVPLLAACSPQISAASPNVNATVTINSQFQQQTPAIPTVTPYRCGAWSSNNRPGAGDTITIYARLTHDTAGIRGQVATAVVHFSRGDTNLGNATSDSGGYVTFKLSLNNQQPANLPATVDVTFVGPPGGAVKCSQAFFTPT
jgi:hypothetical protein